MRPVLFELPLFGGLPIHAYGLMIALGFLTAIYITMWRGKKVGLLPRTIMNCGLLALLGGVAGARIGFIIEKWEQARHWDFWEMINIRAGGLTVTGGVPMAIILIVLYLWIKKIKIHRFLDAAAPAAAIGLTFGRIGCLLNGCCYGQVTDVRWAIQFPAGSPAYVKQLSNGDLHDHQTPPLLAASRDPANGAVDYRELPHHAERISQRIILLRQSGDPLPPHWANIGFLKPYYEKDGGKQLMDQAAMTAEIHTRLEQLAWTPENMCLPVHPTQVYQQITGLLMFGLLTLHWRFRRREGQVCAMFVTLYGLQRVSVAFFRNTSDPIAWNMNPFQWYMLGASIIGVLWYVLVTTLAKPIDKEAIAADVVEMEAVLAAQREAVESKTAGRPNDELRPRRGKRSRRR